VATIKRAGTDRSTNYDRSELEAISIRLVAQDGEVGQGSAPIPDPAGTATPYAGESFQVLVGATMVLDGFVGPLQRTRGPSAAGSRLVDTYTIGDENAVLHGFRAYKWVRSAETTRARFLAFLADFVPWVTDTTWVTTDVVEDMDAKTYTTETLFDELFGEIKDLTGNVAFVENHRAHLHPATLGITGGLSFSDAAYDYSSAFPIYNPQRAKDPMDLRTDVLVVSPTASATATDSTAITRHDSGGLKHQALIEVEKGTSVQVAKIAAATLAGAKAERVTYEFDTGPLTAAQVASIPVGCLINVTSAVLGLSSSTQRIGGMTLKYRHPNLWDAHLELGFPVRIRVSAPRTAPNVCCPPFDGIGSPSTGMSVLNELVWTGDGTTTAGVTAFPYLAGSLSVWVAGLNTTGFVTEDDPTTGAFSLSFAPTSGQTVRVNYTAA
jgi:hypothetical protein